MLSTKLRSVISGKLKNGKSNQIKVSTKNKEKSFPDLLDRAFDEAAKAEDMQGGHHKQTNIAFEAGQLSR